MLPHQTHVLAALCASMPSHRGAKIEVATLGGEVWHVSQRANRPTLSSLAATIANGAPARLKSTPICVSDSN